MACLEGCTFSVHGIPALCHQRTREFPSHLDNKTPVCAAVGREHKKHHLGGSRGWSGKMPRIPEAGSARGCAGRELAGLEEAVPGRSRVDSCIQDPFKA